MFFTFLQPPKTFYDRVSIFFNTDFLTVLFFRRVRKRGRHIFTCVCEYKPISVGSQRRRKQQIPASIFVAEHF